MKRKEESWLVLGNLLSAVQMLQKSRDFASLIPEIRVSLAYATSWAKSARDVAAVEGRIAAVGGYPRAVGLPAYGASIHMASMILALRKFEPEISAAMNFKCNDDIVGILRQYARDKGFKFGMIDRNMKPPESVVKEGTPPNWRLKYMVETTGGVPHVFYENEGMGREQLSIAVGKDATAVAGIALEIARRYKEKMRGKKG